MWSDLPVGLKGRRAVCILNVGIKLVQSLSLPGWAAHILGPVGQRFVKGDMVSPQIWALG